MKKTVFSALPVGIVFCAVGLCRAEDTAASSRNPFPTIITGQIAKSAAKTKPANCGTLQFEIEADYMGNKGSASFLVLNGMQANQVLWSDKRVQPGEDKNDKYRYGFITNVLPVCAANGMVNVQIQIELSAPMSADSSASSWQLQSEFEVKKGQKTVLVSKPAHVEITISDAKPE
ncbi:MAG: hypothetical protein PHP45_09460 [Elusimicrobiales bacterium]|nr:hypothetical protein [Elusimicrobiales bacterium]